MRFEVIAILYCLSLHCTAKVTKMEIKQSVCTAEPPSGISFAELLEISSASIDCFDAVGSVLKAKYDKTHFVIEGPYTDDKKNAVDEQPTSIHLRGNDVVKYFLIKFADIIRYLRISFEHIDSFECEQIIYLISNRLVNSLIELNLEDCKGNMLAYLAKTKPFPKVSHLVFSSSKNDQLKKNTNNFQFTSIFPSLYSLQLLHITESDWDYIGDKWPTLKELNIVLRKPSEQNAEDSVQLLKFLAGNRQISNLSVDQVNLNILNEANKLLSRLLSLRLNGLSQDYSLNYQGDPVRFAKLTVVEIVTNDENEFPENVAFEVQDLHLIIPKFTDKWMEFITNQVNGKITYLNLSTVEIEKSDFLAIPEVLNNLQMVDISCHLELTADDILQFIAKGTFSATDLRILMDDSEEQRLTEHIPVNWDRSPTQKDHGKVRIVLEKLMDCLPKSLKRLDMNSLMKRSRVSDTCMHEARETFEEKYVNTMFKLTGPLEGNAQIVGDGKKKVHLTNMETIKYLLGNFGNFVHRFYVSFASIDVSESDEIVELLNSKSTVSLEELELHSCREGVLDRLGTFNNVFTLTFSSDAFEERPINSKRQKLHKIAPNLYTLKLKRVLVPDWAFLTNVFPNLRKFTVALRKRGQENEIDTTHVVNFLQINPTIGVLAMEHISLMLLKLTNKYLPQLVALYIANLAENYMNYCGESISFKNLQILSIYSNDDVVPGKIVFDQLDKLSLTVKNLDEKWMDFLKNQVNSDLKVFDLTVDIIKIEHFLEISDRIFRFLERVEFICPMEMKAEDIKSFIENGETLYDIILKVRMDLSERDLLNDILIENLNVKFYSFENQEVIIDIKIGDNLVGCDLESLDGESLINLLEKSKLDRQCLEAARSAFKAYSKFTFLFVGPFINDEDEAIEGHEHDEVIIIRNFNVIKNLLTAFGYLIRKLKVDFQRIDTEVGIRIVENIDVKCSHSLTLLNLLNCKENVIEGLKSEYSKVSILRLTNTATDPLVNAKNTLLNTLFPKLEKLSVTFAEMTLFHVHIPILTTFDVELPRNGEGVDHLQIGNFLQINPQIEFLGIYHSSLQVLHEVKEKSPRLKALNLIKISEDFFNYQSEPISFNKLAKLSVYSDEVPEQVTFDQLQMLELFIAPSKFDEKWLHFLHYVNKNLNHLSVVANGLSIEHFMEIAEKLNNLDTLYISSTSKLTANDIITFIGKCKYLMNFEMKIELGESEKKQLMNKLPKSWQRISEKQVDKITLKRASWMMENGVNAENEMDDSENTANTGNSARFLRTTYTMQMFAIIVVSSFITTIF